MAMNTRVHTLLQRLETLGLENCLISAPENIRYFSRFRGGGALLFCRGEAIILTDSRFTEQAHREAPDFAVLEYPTGGFEALLGRVLADKHCQRVGWEDDVLSVLSARSLEDACPGVTWVSIAKVGLRIRSVKDEEEIATLRRACWVTDRGFEYLVSRIQPGVTEREICLDICDYMARTYGAAMGGCGIVAAGENGSMPHAIAGEHVITRGEAVTVDFGANIDGYFADMTRTFAVGALSDALQDIYGIVLDAQLRAVDALAPGKLGREVDAVARDLITAKGYGDFFGHGLGHGVGLLVHESPRLNQVSTEVMQPGMVVTVEPGIYVPGLGGVRIEDTCLVTETGCEVLFTSPKTLITLQ